MNSASEAMFFFTFLLISLISDRIHTTDNAAAATLFSVRQEPEMMEVAPGSNVTMKCHYQGNVPAGGEIQVEWKSNISFIAKDRVNVTGIQNVSLSLNLTSVGRNESGTYVCEVILHIPELSRVKGNGTVLIVTGGQIRFEWKSNLFNTTKRSTTVNVTGIQNGSFCLNLTSVRSNQSGTCVCKVILEIPELSYKEGNGTVLFVRDSVAVSDTRKSIFFIALWTALSMAALTVGIGFLICCKYRGTKPASSTGENDCQVSDALEFEVQYTTLNVRLKSTRPDSRSGQGQISNVSRATEHASAVYSTIR